jgi:hypothetical protein
MNEKYEKRYKRYKALQWWLSDPFGLLTNTHIELKFQPKWIAELEELHKVVFPRRKKINVKNLPENIIGETRTKWANRGIKYYERSLVLYDTLGKWLNENADKVKLIQTEPTNVKSSAIATFRSQGMGKEHYTKMSLKPSLDLLLKYGFEATIEYSENTGYGDGFVLKANCDPYMLDVLERVESGSLLEWAIDCWRSGVNPKVYKPFLPQSIYDASLEKWYS